LRYHAPALFFRVCCCAMDPSFYRGFFVRGVLGSAILFVLTEWAAGLSAWRVRAATRAAARAAAAQIAPAQ
jgi:hypothetical protein